jgi:hypothetical protein
MNLDELQREHGYQSPPRNHPGHTGSQGEPFAVGIGQDGYESGRSVDEQSGLLEHGAPPQYTPHQKHSATDDSWLTPKMYRNGVCTIRYQRQIICRRMYGKHNEFKVTN